MCSIELFVVVEAYGEWLLGLYCACTCGMASVEISGDNVFVDVCDEKSGGFGGNLPVDALFEGVYLCVWKG